MSKEIYLDDFGITFENKNNLEDLAIRYNICLVKCIEKNYNPKYMNKLSDIFLECYESKLDIKEMLDLAKTMSEDGLIDNLGESILKETKPYDVAIKYNLCLTEALKKRYNTKSLYKLAKIYLAHSAKTVKKNGSFLYTENDKLSKITSIKQ